MLFNNKIKTACFLVLVCFGQAAIAEPSASQFSQAIVQIETRVYDNGRTVERLGSERRGSAVVIDASGLLVTVGYLVLEAETITVTFSDGDSSEAEVVANDHHTGLALLRARLPEGIEPIQLGDSSAVGIDQGVVVLNHGGTDSAHVASVASIREFVGSWEYLIDRAFFTTPETRNFSGAALLDRDARLVGIGSLLLSNIYAGVPGRDSDNSVSGNLFIPIEHLSANMGRLLAGATDQGHRRPWLGLTLNESQPDLTVVRVAAQSPSGLAGLQANDALIAINGQRVSTMRGLYETLWSSGDAGVSVELLISRDDKIETVSVKTVSRNQWFLP